jgi:hypothetical protein
MRLVPVGAEQGACAFLSDKMYKLFKLSFRVQLQCLDPRVISHSRIEGKEHLLFMSVL